MCESVCAFEIHYNLPLPPLSTPYVYADLNLGDTHMVAIDDLMSRDEGKDLVGAQNLCLPKSGPILPPDLCMYELVGELAGVHV